MTSRQFNYNRNFKVCMVVYNNFLNDSRVQKEAQTLLHAGYQVTVLALLDNNTEPFEERFGIRIIRVPINPLSRRIIGWMQSILSPGATAKIFLSERLPWYRKLNLKELPIGKFSQLMINCIIAICLFHIFYNSFTFKFISDNKLFVSALICIPLVYSYFKSMKGIIITKLKKLLMPFHRQFCFLSFYINARCFIRKEAFGIYHAHDLNTLPVAYFSAKRDGAKLVYDSHELYVERNRVVPSSSLQKFFLSCVEGFLVKQSDAVFTVNQTIAKEMARRYRIATPHVVMNTPISFGKKKEYFGGNGRLRKELNIPPPKKLLLYVGSITFNRGLEEMIRSLEYLPDCYLVLMGYGQESFKQKLSDLVEEKEIKDRFNFFGPVPSDQVIHYAAGADIGVAPIANACLSYYYCSPNKLFEYMNAGLPVVASNFPELEKVVIGHNIGVTFDPADPIEIADAIRRILSDPEGMRRMANNAVRASGLYNWENESKILLRIYNRLGNS